MQKPDLPSFERLSDRTRELLFAESAFDPYVWPHFNAAGFPIHVEASESVDPHETLLDIFSQQLNLTVEDCQAYNQWLSNSGRDNRAPTNLSGVCAGKPTCKVLRDKFTCGGCGRTIVPRSLQDPACKVHADPWWYEYAKDFLQPLVSATGGISKTDPLILFPDGPFRHGRKLRRP